MASDKASTAEVSIIGTSCDSNQHYDSVERLILLGQEYAESQLRRAIAHKALFGSSHRRTGARKVRTHDEARTSLSRLSKAFLAKEEDN